MAPSFSTGASRPCSPFNAPDVQAERWRPQQLESQVQREASTSVLADKISIPIPIPIPISFPVPVPVPLLTGIESFIRLGMLDKEWPSSWIWSRDGEQACSTGVRLVGKECSVAGIRLCRTRADEHIPLITRLPPRQ